MRCICLAFAVGTLGCEVRVQAEGQEKALRKQKNQGQRVSQENAARTATPTSQPTATCMHPGPNKNVVSDRIGSESDRDAGQ